MDGSSNELMQFQTRLLPGLLIDNKDSQLIWLADIPWIVKMDLDSNNLTLERPKLTDVKSIAVSGDLLYLINNREIQSYHKKSFKYPRIIKKLEWNETVFQMRLYHREGQLQDRVNHCAGGHCSHNCVLTQKYFTCICPYGMYLMEDGLTCAGKTHFVLIM